MKQAKEFYTSKKWRALSSKVKRRDGYKCQESKRFGKSVDGTLVHHIYPLEDYPELALVSWNLITLSDAEHNKFHNRMTGEITGGGLYWQRKFKRRFDEFYNLTEAVSLDQEEVEEVPEDFKPTVTLVWGCPASGKTTYVKEHMQQSDMVVDLDYIKQAISLSGKTEASDKLLPYAISIREHIYSMLEERLVDNVNVWIVAGLPKKIDREYLINRLKIDNVVYIQATKKECLQRATADKERKDKKLQVKIIERWWRLRT